MSKLPEVERTALLDELTSPDSRPQLVVLHAPRGFGKSTLLRQLKKRERSDFGPLSLRDVESQEQFWELLAGSVDTRNLQDFTFWAQGLERPKVLFLDDYEQVSSPELDQQLTDLLLQAPNLRLVVAGRRFSGLSGPLTSAVVTSKVIRADRLRFSSKEIHTVAAGLGAPKQLEQARRDTDGWPLATQLAFRQAAGDLRIAGTPVSADVQDLQAPADGQGWNVVVDRVPGKGDLDAVALWEVLLLVQVGGGSTVEARVDTGPAHQDQGVSVV